ncbi:hypothetical protein FKM82_021128 [Ascaphus truei]
MRIQDMYKRGQRISQIQCWLNTSGLVVPATTVSYHAHGKARSVKRTPTVTTEATTLLVDQISEENDERSATRVKYALEQNHNITASQSSIKVMGNRLGWKYGHNVSYDKGHQQNQKSGSGTGMDRKSQDFSGLHLY